MFDYNKIDFNVEKFQLCTPIRMNAEIKGEYISKDLGVGLRRTDTKEPIAIVKDSYEPVQYKDVVDGIENAIMLSGINTVDAEFKTSVHDDGAKLELRARFPAHKQTMIRQHDEVIPEFVFRTSHDRTWANNGMMGLWRSMCFNTLVNGDKLSYVYGRHTKNFDVDGFASKIKESFNFVACEGMEKLRGWYETRVNRKEAVNLFTNTLAQRTDNITKKKVANKVMLSNLMKIFDLENQHIEGRGHYERYGVREAGTLWTAYQAATYWSSHVDKTKGAEHTTKVNREDRVRKMLVSPQWMELEAA